MSEAHKPADYDRDTVYAIRALYEGKASEGQQQKALRWILDEVCRVRDLETRFGPDGDRQTVFAGGRRFVGQQILKMLDPLVIKALDAAEQKQTGGRTRRTTRGKRND